MPDRERLDEIKRKLRRLKKLEIRIRFEGSFRAANYSPDAVLKGSRIKLVWDDFSIWEIKVISGRNMA